MDELYIVPDQQPPLPYGCIPPFHSWLGQTAYQALIERVPGPPKGLREVTEINCVRARAVADRVWAAAMAEVGDDFRKDVIGITTRIMFEWVEEFRRETKARRLAGPS